MRLGLGIGIGSDKKVAPPIITATSAPVLAPLAAGATIASAYTAGSYASTAGTISSAVATYLRNGSSVANSTVVANGDVIAVSVLVTDSAGNKRTFATAARTVAAAPIDSIVVVGASIMNGAFGQSLATPHSAATSRLAAAGFPVPVYGYGFPGEDMVDATKRYNEARAAHPNALIVMHFGGGDVTATRPYSTMTQAEIDKFQSEQAALLAVCAGDDRFYRASLTFRSYGTPTSDAYVFQHPEHGSLPYNENLVIPWIAANFPYAMGAGGRPKFDLYRFVLSDFENILGSDGIHPTTTGYTTLRNWMVDRIAEVMSGATPALITERVYQAPVAPGAPTGLSATAWNGQVALTWTAPANNGGAAISDYKVEYQPAGGSWTVFADGTSASPSATVTGLTNGVSYSFRVSAINSAGTGPASGTATATPAAPSGLTGFNLFSGTSGSTPIGWMPQWATSPGWVEANGYVSRTASNLTRAAMSSDAAQSSADAEVVMRCMASSAASGGAGIVLRGGGAAGSETGYRFVFANATTLQIARLVSGAATIVASPAYTRSNNEVLWMRARVSGTSLYLRIWRDAEAEPTDWTWTGTDAGLSSAGWMGLAAAGSSEMRFYQFGWATNGSAAPKSAAPPATAPGAPTDLAATAGDGQASLTWTAPASDGGAAISDYQIEVNAGSGWAVFSDGVGTATSATVTGLTNGTAHSFRVSAINSAGTGAASTTATATPEAPSTPASGVWLPAASLTLTPETTAAFATGKFGSGYSTLAAANKLLAPGRVMPATGDFSIEFWFNSNFTHTATGFLVGESDRMMLAVNSTGQTIRLSVWNAVSTTKTDVTSSAVICDGQWHHVAIEYDATTTTTVVYVDGVVACSLVKAIPAGDAARPFSVMGWPNTAQYPARGVIDDLVVYQGKKRGAAFTPPTAAVSSSATDALALWRFDGDLTPVEGEAGAPEISGATISGPSEIQAPTISGSVIS